MQALNTMNDSLGGLLAVAKKRLGWRSNARMIALLVFVVASIVTSLSYTAAADRTIDSQFDAKLVQYRQQAKRIEDIEQMKIQEASFASQVATDASMIDIVPRSRALAEVSNAISPGVRLVGISLDAGDQADSRGMKTTALLPTSLPASLGEGVAKNLRLRGVAGSDAQIAEFVARLVKSSSLHSVRLVSTAAEPAGGKNERRFEITAVFGQ
jgi:Tfp pilus assembly protein PilN